MTEERPNLARFLLRLETDAEFLRAYKENPEATMEQEGLTKDEIHLILEGDNDALALYLEDGPYWIIRPILRPGPAPKETKH